MTLESEVTAECSGSMLPSVSLNASFSPSANIAEADRLLSFSEAHALGNFYLANRTSGTKKQAGIVASGAEFLSYKTRSSLPLIFTREREYLVLSETETCSR